MSSAATRDPSDRRQFFRVEARIPIRLRAIEDGEFDRLRQEIEMPRPHYEGLEPVLADRLAWLEIKLDRVLAHLEGAPPPTPVDSCDVLISGSGLRIRAKDTMAEPQDQLLVEMFLPTSPPRLVRSIGRVVVRSDSHSVEGDLAIEFRFIHEEDRDAVIHFTHEVERVALRRRAERERCD